MLMKIWNKIGAIVRHPNYSKKPPENLKIINLNKYSDLPQALQKIKIKPGWSVFFWHKKVDFIDHIAIVPLQDNQDLNLLNAVLLQGSPPPIDSADNDFSGIRLMTAMEFLGNKGSSYSKIIVGKPPRASKDQLAQAGELAYSLGEAQSFDGKPVFYSFPILNKLLFVKRFNYDTHQKFKFGIPFLGVKKLNGGKSLDWETTYCGDLVGQIYNRSGFKNLPKIKVFGFFAYRSSTFYEWFRKNNTLETAVVWEETNPKF